MLINRVGEINKNKYNTVMKIIEYHSATDVIVEFQDKYKHKTKTSYRNFIKGTVSNPYDKYE